MKGNLLWRMVVFYEADDANKPGQWKLSSHITYFRPAFI